MDERFGRTMSLGALCTSKYQARRVLAARQGLDIHPKARTAVPGAPSAVFDWQITPLAALFEYLRRDFSGMFERDDLTVENFNVTNARYGTIHPHEFPSRPRPEDMIGTYALARSRHDHLASRARSMLRDNVPTLYLHSKTLLEDEYRELRGKLTAFNPAKQFGLLAVGDKTEGWRGNDRIWDVALRDYIIDPAHEAAHAPAGVGAMDSAPTRNFGV